MDHHQWRPIPPPYSHPNICPVCSASHYPFCNPYPHPAPPPTHHHPPPTPPYTQNPRFPPPQYFPWPDPYHGGNPTPYIPPPPDTWQRNPNSNYSEGPPTPMQHNGNNHGNGYVGELDRSNKRPRVDATELGEAERRLKLIRDHGGSGGRNAVPPPKGESVAIGNGSFLNNGVGMPCQLLQPDVHHDPRFRNDDPSCSALTGHSNWVNHMPPPQPPNGVANHCRTEYRNGYGVQNLNEQRGYLPHHERVLPPPLPTSPPPPLPHELLNGSSPPTLFPIPISSPGSSFYGHSTPPLRASAAYASEGNREDQNFLRKEVSPSKPMIIDASYLFKQPYRSRRPDYIVIILRGLPGSGKSYSAKMIRDIEVEGGGDAPRIHSMDDYFMTEVEKVEESDVSKSSSIARNKKPTVKTVMEYCYEPEMEEVYRESMLKAFKKTLEEGTFRLVIGKMVPFDPPPISLDDRNLRVADFAQFWAIAKRSGYEVYISEAAYKDPAGCTARNVHGFTLDDVRKMAGQWEEAPSMYMQLDVKSLFHEDNLKDNGIEEVDMDTEEGDDNHSSQVHERHTDKKTVLPVEGIVQASVSSKDVKAQDAEEDQTSGVKELGKSKWSEVFDEDDRKLHREAKGNVNALSGLVRAYGKKRKSVRWSDQVASTGFSIGAAKTGNMHSLVIGPGAGYNLKANPLPEEEASNSKPAQSSRKSRRQSAFQDRLRAEQESFKAVFDRRKQRIGVLDVDEE
ncbi:YLP motif-containing protein 1 [Linum perenne]